MNTIDLKGDAQVFKELIEGTISEFTDDSIKIVGRSAFANCSQLERVELPSVSSIMSSAFYGCTSLSVISLPLLSGAGTYAFFFCGIQHAEFPLLSNIPQYAFYSCRSLQTVSFASCSRIMSAGFMDCYNLSYAYFPDMSSIGSNAFAHCSNLMSLYLLKNSVARLANSNAFNSTPMSDSTYTGSYGSIYVPASLVDSYKSANNWSRYSDRITAYTE